MQRYRPMIFFAVAFLLATATSVLVFSWLKQQAAGLPQPVMAGEHKLVAVAAADLAWGTKLTPEMIKLVAYPDGTAPDGHFNTADTLNGRVLLTAVRHQEPIIDYKLAPVGSMGGVSGILDPAKRAMSVRVDDVIGVAGFIKPNDRVDVMVTIEPPGGGTGRMVTKTILEHVKVLATGTEMVRTGKEEEAKQVQVVTLEVDVIEAEKLALASNQGRLRLALRNPLNNDDVLTHGATIGGLLASYRPKVAPKPAADEEFSRDQIEVIKGGTILKGRKG
ncbi:MAG TPA: Flp pilus assembly protein CpaB [Nitrospira sp.]|nr:Flp pilus assembly protein CpaB [Nitrospira sp.]